MIATEPPKDARPERSALIPDGRPAPLRRVGPDGTDRPCRCVVCTWTTLSSAPTPIRPSDPAWPILLRMAEAWEETR